MADVLAPDEKLCPFCAERIKKAAVKCRYCQSDLDPAVAEPVPALDLPEPSEPVESPPPPAPPADSGPVEDRGPLLASRRLLVALIVLCLVLLAAAAGTWWWSERRAEDDTVTGAISSAEAREAGIEQAAGLTEKVLSYDWRTLDQSIKSSEAVLAPSFRSEYAKTMAGVRDQTIKNQVKLTATVVASSVVSATSDKVVALVFVNQLTTAKGTNNKRVDQNRVLVTLSRHGKDWRVSKMDAF